MHEYNRKRQFTLFWTNIDAYVIQKICLTNICGIRSSVSNFRLAFVKASLPACNTRVKFQDSACTSLTLPCMVPPSSLTKRPSKRHKLQYYHYRCWIKWCCSIWVRKRHERTTVVGLDEEILSSNSACANHVGSWREAEQNRPSQRIRIFNSTVFSVWDRPSCFVIRTITWSTWARSIKESWWALSMRPKCSRSGGVESSTLQCFSSETGHLASWSASQLVPSKPGPLKNQQGLFQLRPKCVREAAPSWEPHLRRLVRPQLFALRLC